nr:TSUP family transporter [Lysinibacter cavernae]
MLLLVVVAGFAAGWIDAIVGGGGLIQLPVLLLIPGLSPVQALATNKLGSIFGTTTSAITYYRRVKPDLRTAIPAAVFAFLGSFGGAVVASSIPAEYFRPIIVVALIGVFVFTVAKPSLGEIERERKGHRRHLITAILIGLLIGAYDGVMGPGTGSFLVIALVGLLGFTFLQGSAIAKIINVFTNLGALAFFIPLGAVRWELAIALGIANCLGGYLGARMAIAKGSGFVRALFLIVVCVLIVILGWTVVSDWMSAN